MKAICMRFLIIVIVCTTLYSCKQGQKGEQQEGTEMEIENDTIHREGIYALPGDYKVDHPKNLVAYFDSLCHQGAYVATHSVGNEDSLDVWKAIRYLDRYAQGEGKYYPESLIRSAFLALGLEQAYCFGHGGPDDKNGGEAFLFRLIEQAALHCNQIDYITDFHANDSKVGVLYFGAWGAGLPLYSFLVYQAKQGFRVLTIGDVGEAKVNQVFHLTDKQGRDYYLCSNNENDYYFCQYLYGWEDEDLRLIRKMDVDFSCPGSQEKGLEIVFNPNQCTWSFCNKDGDIYHRVDGTPVLRLMLDGKASKFVVE